MKNVCLFVSLCGAFLVNTACLSGPELSPSQNSTPSSKYTIVLDESLIGGSTVSTAAWMTYSNAFKADMEHFYAANPGADYVPSFASELYARESLVTTYKNIRATFPKDKDNAYLREVSMIKDAGFLKEYVYASFNPGTWPFDATLGMEKYDSWKTKTMPDHRSRTLGKLRRS